jgi:hypothetical protein
VGFVTTDYFWGNRCCYCVRWITSLEDRDGNSPQTVARGFVEAVQRGDFRKAESYWAPGAVTNIEANFRVKFEDFCIERFKCDRYELTSFGKQKAEHYLVQFLGTEDGREKAFAFYAKEVEGEWKLMMHQWLRKDNG